MPQIGQYATEKARAVIEPDLYTATITAAEIVMDKDKPGIPMIDQWGKSRLLLKVELDDEIGPDNGPIELRRQLAISYGQTAGTYAALAQLIQAVTGVKCGDHMQRQVTTEELVGAKVRVQTAIVEKDGKSYTNIVGFFAPKRAAARPAPAPIEQTTDEELEDDIPF